MINYSIVYSWEKSEEPFHIRFIPRSESKEQLVKYTEIQLLVIRDLIKREMVELLNKAKIMPFRYEGRFLERQMNEHKDYLYDVLNTIEKKRIIKYEKLSTYYIEAYNNS